MIGRPAGLAEFKVRRKSARSIPTRQSRTVALLGDHQQRPETPADFGAPVASLCSVPVRLEGFVVGSLPDKAFILFIESQTADSLGYQLKQSR
jgi:hypothetical protein